MLLLGRFDLLTHEIWTLIYRWKSSYNWTETITFQFWLTVSSGFKSNTVILWPRAPHLKSFPHLNEDNTSLPLWRALKPWLNCYYLCVQPWKHNSKGWLCLHIWAWMVLWAKYLLSLHPNKCCWKYCSRWLLTLCLPACFSKRILNKALDSSKMYVLDFCHRNQSTEIHGTGHMPLFRLKCTAAAQSQLQGAPNIKSTFNPGQVILHQPHLDASVPTEFNFIDRWNMSFASTTDSGCPLKNCLISSLGVWKSSIRRKRIRCCVLTGFDRYKIIVMTPVNMLSSYKENKRKIGKKKK